MPQDYIPEGSYDIVDLETQKRESIGLEWINVSYKITTGKGKDAEEKTIIHPMSGNAHPGEMLALMVHYIPDFLLTLFSLYYIYIHLYIYMYNEYTDLYS